VNPFFCSELEKVKAQIKKTNEVGSEIITLNAENQGDYLGYITYNTKTCYLYSLFVDEKFRKQGIGTQLFQTAMKDLHEHGCNGVKWGAFPDGINFFQKQGASFVYAYNNSYYWDEPNRPVQMKVELGS
jgi:GNAT superfamily N-acetyltransferase